MQYTRLMRFARKKFLQFLLRRLPLPGVSSVISVRYSYDRHALRMLLAIEGAASFSLYARQMAI